MRERRFVLQADAVRAFLIDVQVERHTVPLGPIVGAVALAGGIALLLAGNRRVA